MEYSKLLPELEKALADKEKFVIFKSIQELGKIGNQEAKNILTKILTQRRDTNIRLRAMTQLLQIGGTDVVLTLGKALNYKDLEIRLRAASCLGWSKNRAAIPILSKALSDED